MRVALFCATLPTAARHALPRRPIPRDLRGREEAYALLQTPVFVEEFILDRTLEPALNERPLEGFKMIDPTCGSGHFLLGGFQRLLDRWHSHAPGLDERERVQTALDSVFGVDVTLSPSLRSLSTDGSRPFSVRLAAARRSACHSSYHLAMGDSLLHGLDQLEFDLGSSFSPDRAAANFAYATENLSVLRSILRKNQYDVVIGNPPYITVKDKSLSGLYRRLYAHCKGKYALTVPFMERFFGLAKSGTYAGWVGQITSNSFMKREFGERLIEDFLPRKNLTLVIDSSGAYIPGHGTPTAILVGKHQSPTASSVRAVLGVRGEPGIPDKPEHGLVWSSIVANVDVPGASDEWVSVTELDRSVLDT